MADDGTAIGEAARAGNALPGGPAEALSGGPGTYRGGSGAMALEGLGTLRPLTDT